MSLLYLAIGPSVIILTYIYMKDKYDKEPKRFLLKLFLLGCLSVVPAVMLELLTSTLFQNGQGSIFITLLYAFIGVALVEEGLKYAILKGAAWKKCEFFNQKYDAIVYAVFISLGFATVENTLYVFQNGYATGLIRAITAVPAHAIFATAMGYFMGFARFLPKGRERTRKLVLSFLVPILLHGLYDFFLMSEIPILLILYIPFIIFMYVFAIKKINRLADVDNQIMGLSQDDDCRD
ncbi:MAG: PrsW family intramembrane metalloprotease [Clostridiales bacterium]|nr:PrsW family intramembrane metalloprotease [Clostridiales bacterium]